MSWMRYGAKSTESIKRGKIEQFALLKNCLHRRLRKDENRSDEVKNVKEVTARGKVRRGGGFETRGEEE